MRHLSNSASDAVSAALAVPSDQWEQCEVQRVCVFVRVYFCVCMN